ncbi:hypothetical protein EYF80_038413 [Liparis tanakae]|uniref:Uncharacterized protein n=1 Tax=Liparis tanakae TaxID=230148 RepID=A0A4Z2GCS6_9TELE|nr:hypothetical protein EYF80_038413 [Liparis tanakae]
MRSRSAVPEWTQVAVAVDGVAGQVEARQLGRAFGERLHHAQLVVAHVQVDEAGAPGHGRVVHVLQGHVVQEQVGQLGHGHHLLPQRGEGLGVQVVQGVVAEAEPLDVLQALQGEDRPAAALCHRRADGGVRHVGHAALYLEGHVGDVDQPVVGERQQVEEAQLREGSGLDLLHAVTVHHELLQRGQAVQRLLGSRGETDNLILGNWKKSVLGGGGGTETW